MKIKIKLWYIRHVPIVIKNDIAVEVIRRIKEPDFKAAPSYAFAISASGENAFGNVKNTVFLSKYSFLCFEYFHLLQYRYNYFAFILLKVGLSTSSQLHVFSFLSYLNFCPYFLVIWKKGLIRKLRLINCET